MTHATSAPPQDELETYISTADDKVFKSAKRAVQVVQNGMRIQVDLPKSEKRLREQYAQMAVRFYALERLYERIQAILRKQGAEYEDVVQGLEEILEQKIYLANKLKELGQ